MDALTDIKHGSEQRFTEVYLEYQEKLYFFIKKLTKSPYLAEEVVQQTFIRLWARRAGLSDQYTLEEQLFRMARTILIDEIRKDVVRKKYAHNALNTSEPAFDPATTNPHLEKEIHKAINELPPARKQIFQLSRVEGYSHKEVAQQLSISPKTVENQIGKAIKQLKHLLTSFF